MRVPAGLAKLFNDRSANRAVKTKTWRRRARPRGRGEMKKQGRAAVRPLRHCNCCRPRGPSVWAGKVKTLSRSAAVPPPASACSAEERRREANQFSATHSGHVHICNYASCPHPVRTRTHTDTTPRVKLRQPTRKRTAFSCPPDGCSASSSRPSSPIFPHDPLSPPSSPTSYV